MSHKYYICSNTNCSLSNKHMCINNINSKRNKQLINNKTKKVSGSIENVELEPKRANGRMRMCILYLPEE